MSTFDLGTLTSTPGSYDDFTVTPTDPTDVYEFNIASTSSINLSLNEISFNDDADLYLYRDSNGNGTFDDGLDEQVTSSLRTKFSNGAPYDDMINTRADAGTYFAVVKRYDLGSDGDITYELDLSATPTQPSLSSPPPNLLPYEVVVGHAGILPSSDRTFDGSVGDSNTADVYYFKIGDTSGRLNGIRLSGLSNDEGIDADIRLIQDSNNNRIVDPGEVIGSSTAGGNTEEWIPGDQLGRYVPYMLQVYQYSGNTDYKLTFDMA